MGQAKLKGEKADALLAAFERFVGSVNKNGGAVDAFLLNELVVAHNAYKDVSAKLAADAPADPNTFFCPHCDAERPGYNWRFNQGDVGTFDVACLTCVCAKCKNILSVTAIGFQPHAQLAEQLKRQFLSKNLQGFTI